MQKYVQLTVHSQPSHTSNKFNFPFGYQHVHVSFLFKNVKNDHVTFSKDKDVKVFSVQTADTVQT
jgi:hypothetical protein